jgi:phytoene dehydrogenase-like protein
VVIGGGQAGLAAGYHLRRLGIEFVILDSRSTPGGAWQRTWESLHLFSPAAFSSLPGWLMPTQAGEEYPDTTWVTQRPPRFLADDIDGRALFDAHCPPPRSRRRRYGHRWRRLARRHRRRPARTRGTRRCTGFRPALSHLAPLKLRETRSRILTAGTQAVAEPRLHLLGYGDWTGPASATLIGVGRTARDAARAVAELVR